MYPYPTLTNTVSYYEYVNNFSYIIPCHIMVVEDSFS